MRVKEALCLKYIDQRLRVRSGKYKIKRLRQILKENRGQRQEMKSSCQIAIGTFLRTIGWFCAARRSVSGN